MNRLLRMPLLLSRNLLVNPVRKVVQPVTSLPSPLQGLQQRLWEVRQAIALPNIKDILEQSILRVSTFRRKKTKVRKSRRKQKLKKLK